MRRIIKFKKMFVVLAAFMAVVLPAMVIVAPAIVSAAAGFQGGNVFLVSNTNNPAWVDPVSANVGDIVEFHLEIVNNGNETATNVRVEAELPANEDGTSLSVRIKVKADNASEISDTATVNVPATSTRKSLTYFPGHATLIKHPGNVTSSIEAIGTGGEVSIGDLAPGGNVFAEVLFKAQLTEVAVVIPTPTPTPVVVVTPTPTPVVIVTPMPTPVPAAEQQVDLQCPAGFISVVSGSNIFCLQQVQNNNQNQTVNQTVNATGGSSTASGGSSSANATSGGGVPVVVAAAQPAVVVAQPQVAGVSTKVTELPKTGLPVAAWVLSGLLPAGLGLRKFGSFGKDQKDTARYLWQKREFERE